MRRRRLNWKRKVITLLSAPVTLGIVCATLAYAAAYKIRDSLVGKKESEERMRDY